MYIKGGMKKMAKAIAKSAKENITIVSFKQFFTKTGSSVNNSTIKNANIIIESKSKNTLAAITAGAIFSEKREKFFFSIFKER